MYPKSKVTVTIGDNPEWHCRQDDSGFWDAWKSDPADEETGAPVYRSPSFDDLVKMIDAYEKAYEEGFAAARVKI